MRNKCFVQTVFVRSLQNKETRIMKVTDYNFHCEYYPRGPALRLKMSEIKQRKLYIIDCSKVLQITQNNLQFTICWQKEFKGKLDLKFC